MFLLLTLFSYDHAVASNYDQKIYYDQQIKDLKKEIDQVDDRKELIGLTRKRNELVAYKRAYHKALELSSNENTPIARMYLNQMDNMPPAEYIKIYQDAADQYNIDWTILAAIHEKETSFSTHKTMISSAGAVGHMQFMPGTFDFYGVDGNGDGIIDPWNIYDAIYSAANYLSATGASDNKINEALFAYNRSKTYGNEIISRANAFKEAYSYNNVDVVDVGKKFIGNSVYVFGGGRNENDIDKGIFDCSSFVHWAFDEVGINLGSRSTTTTDTLKHLGKEVDLKNIQPGDLVFFDTYKKDGHVGIYAGNGQFIGSQTSTGVDIADMSSGYWKEKFNGRIKRIN